MAANLMCSNDGGGDDGDDECHTAVEWGRRHVETLQGCCCGSLKWSVIEQHPILSTE